MVHEYDIASNSFTVKDDGTAVNNPRDRQSHSAAFAGGRIYVFGGVDGDFYYFSNDVFEFDIDGKAWTIMKGSSATSSIGPSLRIHGAFVFLNEYLYYIGGTGTHQLCCAFLGLQPDWAAAGPKAGTNQS